MLLGMLSSFTRPNPLPTETYEHAGFIIGQILFFVLSLWLIYSGIKGRKKIKKEGKKREKIKFIDFTRLFFTKYKNFLTKYISEKRPPFFFLIMVIFGVSRFLDRVQSGIFSDNPLPIHDWLSNWFCAVIFGFVIGFVGYWLIGSIYHLFVRLAGGAKNPRASRNIFLYSMIPSSLAIIITQFIKMLVFGNSYFEWASNQYLNIASLVLWILGSIYGFILFYIGARDIQKTGKIRSIIFFLIIPILFFGVIISGAFMQ